MSERRTIIRRYRRLALGLAVLSMFVLVPVALAAFGASGAGGCGDFDETVATARAGDVLLPMVGGTFTGNSTVTISRTLTIQGGWSPPNQDDGNPNTRDCSELGRYTFTSAQEMRNFGFTFDPTQRSELSGSGSEPVLTISPQAGTVFLRSLEFPFNFPLQGGGINGVVGNGAHLRLGNVAFHDNLTETGGSGGGLNLEVRGGSRLIINSNEIFSNEADRGGGFDIGVYDESQLIIRNTQVATNTARADNGGGGRIFVESGHITITDSLFFDNEATNEGGGLRIEVGQGPAYIWLINTDFSNNSAEAGRALSVVSSGGPAYVWLLNTRFDGSLDPSAPQVHTSGNVSVTVLDKQVLVPVARVSLPTRHYAQITGIGFNDSTYYVHFQTFNFQPQLPGEHVHFFFDTVPPDQAGRPGTGPWFVYSGASPFTGYGIANRPRGANRMCILVANPDHSVQAQSGNCFELP